MVCQPLGLTARERQLPEQKPVSDTRWPTGHPVPCAGSKDRRVLGTYQSVCWPARRGPYGLPGVAGGGFQLIPTAGTPPRGPAVTAARPTGLDPGIADIVPHPGGCHRSPLQQDPARALVPWPEPKIDHFLGTPKDGHVTSLAGTQGSAPVIYGTRNDGDGDSC